MTVKMDKFGRILIPKKMREEMGADSGQKFTISFDGYTGQVYLEPIIKENYEIAITDFGLPIIKHKDPRVANIDFVEMIKQDREDRAKKLWGNVD
ncbi:MAG: AbrB/MazE/SpoVT family DNA-binding domain-containing protein [Bacteroidota bacterium]